MKNLWKTLSSKVIYQNAWLKLREDKVIKPDGKKGIYGVVQVKQSVFIVALTEKKEVYLINLYRYPVKKNSWEIPAGGTDKKNPLKAARRELLEETGLMAKKLKIAGSYYDSNGICEHLVYVVVARELIQTHHNEQKEEGISKIKKVPFAKVVQMISRGKITDGETIAALLIAGLKVKLL